MKPSTKRHLYVAGTIAIDLAAWAAVGMVFHVPGYLIYALIVYMTEDTQSGAWYFWTLMFSVGFWFRGTGIYGMGKAHDLDKKAKKALESRYDRASGRFPDVAPEPGDLELADDAQTMKGGLGR